MMGRNFIGLRRKATNALARVVSGRRILAACAFVFAASVSAAAQQQAQPYDLLPVPSVTVYPGDVIDRDMLKEMNFLPNTRSRYPVVDNIDALVGKVARRTLVPERLIPSNAVEEPEIIARGSLTRAVYQSGGLSMTAGVLALEAGSLGDVIRVRNVDSGQVIAGVVQADGSVKVGQ
ncbi:flagellar basal body P-ring formation chaperone FlgA [Afifella sp. JA880]|uniref:flagellar basal body P-ring formation chaperone FlgA n=1 Tax=Afifella sp. JA880 TaxID=2975280 RepID=UPI0021BAB407|nr:flagellar basal body P-ring formation chaperone FlgA [Afifella sp. JA880]MCT8267835.1 flagellar basal body P-ring formation chaperone FlgA [Afifella sp. JA880]